MEQLRAMVALVAGMAASAIFFRLYAAHDFREIAVRLLKNTYEGGDGAALNHTGRHAVRIGFCVLLALAVGQLTLLTVPAFGAVLGIGYLIFDPTLNKDRGLGTWYTGLGNKWDALWQKLTGRPEQAGRWSAYLEALLVLLFMAWYLILVF